MTVLKGIVLLLVLANVGYFLWARGIAGEPPVTRESVAVPTLKLAAELPLSAPAAGAVQNTGTDAGNDDGSGGKTVVSGTVPTGAAAPAPGDPGSSAPGLPATSARCVSIGPFRDVAEAARAAAALRTGGYDPRQRVAEGEVWAGVWVYLAAPPTRAAGDQVLAKLHSGGIDDALEMPGPNDAPVISLGLYSEPKRAQARVTQAQALGLNPALADRRRSGDVYWIDVDLKPTDGPINPADLQGDSRRILRLQVAACPVAST